jgi:hypothetical protein
MKIDSIRYVFQARIQKIVLELVLILNFIMINIKFLKFMTALYDFSEVLND